MVAAPKGMAGRVCCSDGGEVTNGDDAVRWYRIRACRCAPDHGPRRIEWSTLEVQACGVIAAFDEVRRTGWWPMSIMSSGWGRADADQG